MKIQNFLLLCIAAILAVIFSSCEGVDPGHKAAFVSWGGKTDTTQVYSEGLHWTGFGDMVQYDCRQKTLVQDYDFNDRENMPTGVEIAIDWNIDPLRVAVMHTQLSDLEAKLEKTLKSAAKEVIPQYTAEQLNITNRQEAENQLSEILSNELPNIFCIFQRVQITDVDIPEAIAKLAVQTAEQVGRNKLAKEKEAEQTALAAAAIATAKGKFEAAEYDAKTQALLSRPEMLALKRLEIEMKWAEKGVSPYGSNNVFGSGATVVKTLPAVAN